MAEPRTIPTEEERARISDLLRRSTLQTVEYHSVEARRLTENKQREEHEDSVDVSMSLKHHFGEDSFGILLQAQLFPYRAEVTVAVAAEYSIDSGGPAEDAVVRGFGNEVAVMTLLPFAREAVATLSTRVFGKPILLPTLSRGEVGFDLDD
ncbi:hypothetical protein PQI51_03105 [Microbacterium esteraromaticum]|uniref:hypothetical protein n=1 Tax=Microbacterium esteraromaticum TaxID=57043 RepID=UPI0030AD7952